MRQKTKTSYISDPNSPLAKTYLGKQQLMMLAALVAITLLALSALWANNTIPAGFVAQVEGSPSIAIISEPIIDHGDLIVNNFVTSSFEIQNVGDETLIILSPWVEVHEGCCPPQAVISNQRLRPGEIATVSMRYQMHPGMDGPHDLRIHVRSNDPNNPEIELIALSNWVRG
jgi:uncharacterized protein DUF1573